MVSPDVNGVVAASRIQTDDSLPNGTSLSDRMSTRRELERRKKLSVLQPLESTNRRVQAHTENGETHTSAEEKVILPTQSQRSDNISHTMNAVRTRRASLLTSTKRAPMRIDVPYVVARGPTLASQGSYLISRPHASSAISTLQQASYQRQQASRSVGATEEVSALMPVHHDQQAPLA